MGWVRWLQDVDRSATPAVGGKCAALGEMLRHLLPLGVRVPDGFAIGADAYRETLARNGLQARLRQALEGVERAGVDELGRASARARELILQAKLPDELQDELRAAYRELSRDGPEHDPGAARAWVAVRSSATSEDSAEASFAGQHDSFLEVTDEARLMDRVRRCWASLFHARAISYRLERGLPPEEAAMGVCVQRIVRADRASAGVVFTLDPESGSRDVVFVTSSWGLGENVVQGRVGPDGWYVHKESLRAGYAPIVLRRPGPKELRLVWDERSGQLVQATPTPEERARPSLTDDEVLELARWALKIEEHWSAEAGGDVPMDIEWAKDGPTGQLHVVQARPETVHARREGTALRIHTLEGKGPVLASGLAVGQAIATGRARVLKDPSEGASFQKGEVLVTEISDPDWEPILKLASAIVTERGGRTSHAAIVARELGIPAVVGAEGACAKVPTGAEVTVSCAEGEAGRVYQGALPFSVETVDPKLLPRPRRTKLLLNVGDPGQALRLSRLPSDGVGLARMEFVFASWARVHPLALTRRDRLSPEVRAQVDELVRGHASPEAYLVDTLSQGIGLLAAAFWPRPVVLRFSDFKSNEYAHLLGGDAFEPEEENPMIGWRGASRYDHPDYRDGFLLEVEAIKRVRERFGLRNLHVMVPFCRTPKEGRAVVDLLRRHGLERGKDGLQVWVMAEIPANIILAEQFAEEFDGFSIGSNDLTQLVLGVDRDSERVAGLFDERDEAVKRACASLIAAARRAGRPVSICGQAPSDHPDFAAFLVERGIDSISVVADALISARRSIAAAEELAERRRAATTTPFADEESSAAA